MRAFQDVAPIAAEYGLSPQHTAALEETFTVQHIDTDKPGRDADAAAAVGAHPIGALMAVHTLQQEKRKLAAPIPHSPQAQRAALV